MSHAQTHSLEHPAQTPAIIQGHSSLASPGSSASWGGTLARGSAKVLGHVLAWCLGTLFAVVIQAVLSGFAQSAEPALTESTEGGAEISLSAPETLVESLILDDSCQGER